MTIDYREKAIWGIAFDCVSNTTGIYSQAVIDEKGNRTERTEWQNGWNACFYEVTDNVYDAVEFIKNLPDQIQDYIFNKHIGIRVNDEPQLYVNCNDLFYWACADQEDFELSDLDDFNKCLKDSRENGDILWVCRKRKMRPQKPYYKYFNEEEKVLFDACGPERDE